jgi:WD40 repeat protein
MDAAYRALGPRRPAAAADPPPRRPAAGDALASCGGDRTVRVWEPDPAAPARWRCAAVLEDAHSRTARCCAWSPDGRSLATASFDKTVAIWRRARGGAAAWEHAALLEGHESEVKCVAWAPGGALLATCGRDKSVWVWEAAPGDEFEVVDVKHGHGGDVKAVAWHPSGELLASASYDDSIKLWVECGDEWVCAQTLERGAEGGGTSAGAAGGPAAQEGHASTVWGLAFEPSGGRLASCSDDRSVRVWRCARDAGEGAVRYAPLAALPDHHARTVFSVDWSADGLLASGGADDAIAVVRAGEGAAAAAEFAPVCRREGAHAGDVNCVRWRPVGERLLASAGDDGAVKLWRLVDGGRV